MYVPNRGYLTIVPIAALSAKMIPHLVAGTIFNCLKISPNI
jgi:hypothetical protein